MVSNTVFHDVRSHQGKIESDAVPGDGIISFGFNSRHFHGLQLVIHACHSQNGLKATRGASFRRLDAWQWLYVRRGAYKRRLVCLDSQEITKNRSIFE